MRLTRKGTRKAYQCTYELKTKDGTILSKYEPKKEVIEECNRYNKLADLEDIEEELGIDLVTLFKVLNSKELYKKGVFTNFVTKPEEKIVKREFKQIYLINFLDAKEIRIEIVGNSYREALYFENYGKTWALTKEELEK